MSNLYSLVHFSGVNCITTMNTNTKRTTIFLNLKQLERLAKNALRTGLKFSEQVRRAIDEFLDKEEVK